MHTIPIDPGAFTILVVDDTPMNLKVVGDYLAEIGFRVLIARNGESGLRRAQHAHPDLILLDVLMPGIDGFETCRQLKADTATAGIPIIFMTALAETEYKVKGFEVGAVDYVTKPIQQQELLARVLTHLRIRELTEGLEQLVDRRTRALEATLQREQQLTRELQLALARETELNELKTQIISVVSHEFRTPLNIISTSSHLLSHYHDKMTDAKRQSIAARIDDAIVYLTELLDDALFVNGAAALDGPADLAPVDVRALCLELLEQTQRQYGERPTETTFEGVDRPLALDTRRVRRILSNLLSNAFKFSPPDSPVTLAVHSNGRLLAVTVCDRGIGIPEKDLPHIFDRFLRGSNVEAIRGLGLGLTIVKQLTDGLGGRITAESAGPGQGSCFTVELPIAEPVGAAAL